MQRGTMKTIVPAFELVQKLHHPKMNKGEAYTRSCFCLSLPCQNGTLLYQTMTGEMVLLESDETIDDKLEELVRHGFYVPAGFDEHKLAMQIRSVAAMMQRKKPRSTFLLPTTTDCNARCYYCFELGTKRIDMTPEIARDAAAYMIRVSGDEELKLTWFGGEPLYNRRAIEIICAELKKASKPFRSVMVTNGYYLDPETSRIAYRDWNLKLVQITLDGTKEVYQRTKAYIEHDPNAFERVIRNIRGASDAGIKVLLRFNMDAKNANDLMRLTYELKESLAGCGNITGECELLREYIGKIGRFSSEQEAAETWLRLQNRLDAQWPRSKDGLPKSILVNSCIADNDACETILPDGSVGKCDRIDFKNTIGSITTTETDQKEKEAWKETVTFPECSICPFFPQCIVLKRCKGAKDGCAEALRIRKRWELEEKMLIEYERYKNETR